MNPVFHAAGQTADLGWLMGVMTVVFIGFFIAWTLWAWAPSNREAMEAAARLPLEELD